MFVHIKKTCLTLNDSDKFDILNNIWVPEENFEFPCQQIDGQNRRFSFSWLKKYKWLVYSQSEDSVYCKVCMIFAPNEVGMSSSQCTGQLVTDGFD